MSFFPSALLGAATWGAAEYLIHRFAGHEYAKSRNLFSVEHVRHHATVSYFAPTSHKVAAAAAVAAMVGPLASAALGRRPGLAYTAGLTAMYGAYEVLHRLAHTRAPKTAYGRWLRRHHFHHHFHDPSGNHGVTSPIGDLLAGTKRQVGVVRVPRRQAMPWLLDERGELRSEHAGDYELVGRASTGEVSERSDR
jgi:sterol desaturase/sphingolipid hydroxylase (fatty acid hydroxylase superfamily)